MTSWKTTLFGLISAAAGFVALNPALFTNNSGKWIQAIAGFVCAGGLAGLGIAAKDAGVTGGTIPNKTNDPTVVSGTGK